MSITTDQQPSQSLLIDAINYAAIQHRYQKRKDSDKTPYINHPIGVMNILANECNIHDNNVLIAAVLHDTIEDTDTTYNDIVTRYGKYIADIVQQCTDDKSLPASQRKIQQIEHAKHNELSYQAKLVKLADKLYNLRDIIRAASPTWNINRIQGYMIWAKQVTQYIDNANDVLRNALNKVYKSKIIYQGQSYDCIPCDVNTDELLKTYYKSLDK